MKFAIGVGIITLIIAPCFCQEDQAQTLGSVVVAKPGVARWPIKTSVVPGASGATAANLPLSDFLVLPAPEGVQNLDPRFQSARIPRAPGARLGDGDIVKTTGYLRLVAGEADGDYHIQITGQPDNMDDSLVVEVPDPSPEFVRDRTTAALVAPVRTLIDTKVIPGLDPLGYVLVQRTPPLVEVTGQLFYDDAHVTDMSNGRYRGKSIHGVQLPSKTLWEIHPVIDLKLLSGTPPARPPKPPRAPKPRQHPVG